MWIRLRWLTRGRARRAAWIGIATGVAALCLSAAVVSAQAPPPLGAPLPGLSAAELLRFEAGRLAFGHRMRVPEGLGPVFNGPSCAACHPRGGGSRRLVTRFGTVTGGGFDPLLALGGSVIQNRGIGRVGTCRVVGERVPAAATIVARRRTTPLFGLGLVDAVSDAQFEQIATTESSVSPSTAGRPNHVTSVVNGTTVIGTFGWKAQVASLFEFAGDAALNEMGITNPLFPSENCPQGVCSTLVCDPVADPEDDGQDISAFSDLMTFLAPAAPLPARPDTALGASLFTSSGCANCHLPDLQTGPHPVQALNQVMFHPYSDFLLHDMGSLGDGIEQGEANGREMRTAPLWGLRAVTRFLHDGRAANVRQAILAHDGQGADARDAFTNLSPADQAVLLRFLKRL